MLSLDLHQGKFCEIWTQGLQTLGDYQLFIERGMREGIGHFLIDEIRLWS